VVLSIRPHSTAFALKFFTRSNMTFKSLSKPSFKGAFFALGLVVGCSKKEPPQIVQALYLEPAEFNGILNAIPQSLDKEGMPRGTAGALYYAKIRDIPHLLFIKFKGRGEAYGEFSGPLEKRNDQTETFLQGILRVTKTYSAGLYSPSQSEVNKGKIYYSVDGKNHKVVIAAMEASRVYLNGDFKEAQSKCNGAGCQEGEEFIWVPVRAILAHGNVEEKLPLGNGKGILLGEQIAYMLPQIPFKKILMDIDRGD
jgi:hypothetical protein